VPDHCYLNVPAFRAGRYVLTVRRKQVAAPRVGAYQREVGPECAMVFWQTLVEGDVLAYLCSHILAFDVQVHRGILQVCTAGASTAHRMPQGIEYLHFIQAAIDAAGVSFGTMRGAAFPYPASRFLDTALNPFFTMTALVRLVPASDDCFTSQLRCWYKSPSSERGACPRSER
jgi:hypothetical protein